MGWGMSNQPCAIIRTMGPELHQTWMNHLEELRKRLIVALAALGVSTVGAFFYSDRILEVVSRPITRVIGQVYFFSPADAFMIKIKVSILAGFLLALPVMFGELWGFVAPGLRPNEKKWILPLAFVSSFFFLAGVLFAYCEVIPPALQFFIGQQTEFLKPMVSMTEYVSFLSGMLLAFGVAFNLPVAVVGLVWAGILSVKTLNKFQRHAILMIFIASAILTPSPDAASQLFLAVPLLGLFELSIGVSWIIERMKSKRTQVMVPHE